MRSSSSAARRETTRLERDKFAYSRIVRAATNPAEQILVEFATTPLGLSTAQATQRLAEFGPNAVSSHRARLWPVLWHQLRSPLLGLLLIAAGVSFFVGEQVNALIIVIIVGLSVGLGFSNEYRAERAAQALHSKIEHYATALRDARFTPVEVTTLVPGDIVELRLGDIVPADIRLLTAGLACDESVLTGESWHVAAPCPAPRRQRWMPNSLLAAELSR